MFTVICYRKEKRIDSLSFSLEQEALLYAQMLYNTGDYESVRVFDENMRQVFSV